jgi:hypothetical protein
MQIRRCVAALAAAAIGLALSAGAHAATVTYATSLDLNAGTTFPNEGHVWSQPQFPALDLTLSPGAVTLDWTISFLPGQSLSVGNVTNAIARLFGDSAAGYQKTSWPVVTLLNDGVPVATNTQEICTVCSPSANLFLGTANNWWLPGPVTFNAIEFTQGLNIVSSAPVHISGGSLTIAGASVVPEPESWALMIGGMGLIGLGLRRRRVRLAD